MELKPLEDIAAPQKEVLLRETILTLDKECAGYTPYTLLCMRSHFAQTQEKVDVEKEPYRARVLSEILKVIERHLEIKK